MDKPIIEVKNLGKRYSIAHMRGGYITLRDVIATVVKNPFSFLKHKTKQAVGLEKKEEFWALRNVSFSVQKGEVIGMIGANGAGKSTLLKILSQITPPTEGEVVLRGRVGSLLEVGTGFHPELTGRENIFLNGAILGMKKKEIAKKFDEIVAFAGVDKFLDTPVKHYSSGMHVRLAFSVAAHMDPEILMVDEVLAVGDAEFQKKCLGKMDEITKKDGRTILFVSHNMAAIQQLCPRSILLKQGALIAFGNTSEIIETYLKTSQTGKNDIDTHSRRGDGRIILKSFHTEDESGRKISSIQSGQTAAFVLAYTCAKPQEIQKVDVGFSISKNGSLISKIYSSYMGHYFSNISHSGQFRFFIQNIPLNSGTYEIGVRVLADGTEADWPKGDIGTIVVNNSDFYGQPNAASNDSAVLFSGTWK